MTPRFQFASLGLALVLACGPRPSATRADEKFNPTGLWKLTATSQAGQTFQSTLRLSLEGTKLTGIYTGPRGNEMSIDEAQLKDGTLLFRVSREVDGNKFTSKFQGRPYRLTFGAVEEGRVIDEIVA